MAKSIDPKLLAEAHNDMAAEYDTLDDLWYPWLFAQIHEQIARGLCAAPRRTGKAIDVGCGSGFQSFILAQAGYDVIGFDIASDLLEVARLKASRFLVPPMESPPLFTATHAGRWFTDNERRLSRRLEIARAGRPIGAVVFQLANLLDFDYDEAKPDVIVCCGSVLSFVDGYREAVRRMAMCLAPGGRIFLEVEQKLNPDLFWPVADLLTGGRLGYDQSWSECLGNLFSAPGKSVRIDYPFELHDGKEIVLPIWAFSVRELAALFDTCGLRIQNRIGIHHITNLLPSTVLHRSCPTSFVSRAFESLRRLDAVAAGVWPFWRLGCSVMYELEKL